MAKQNRLLSRIKHALIPNWARNQFYAYLNNKIYKEMECLPECKYEDFLCKRYTEMQNRFQYTQGGVLDFNNPITYTQKLNWMKLYGYGERESMLSDKYAVRKHIEETIGKEYLIPLITMDGKDHFYDAKEIDFDKLPNSFVMKCNHGSHYNIIVKDKSNLSKRAIRKMKRQLNVWLQEKYEYKVGLELVYKGIKPCVIIEKYMAINDDLPDYKFMCFGGTPQYVWCDQGRFTAHKRSLYSIDYEKQAFTMGVFPPLESDSKPSCYGEMLQIVNQLCADFPCVRIDLYDIEGKVYFGEYTLSSGAGFESPNPIEWDAKLGNLIQIDQLKREINHQYRR